VGQRSHSGVITKAAHTHTHRERERERGGEIDARMRSQLHHTNLSILAQWDNVAENGLVGHQCEERPLVL
jgi:hypothetical protein